MEHGGQSEKLGDLGHVNIQSRIFSVPCLIHQVRIGLPRCQVKFSFTIVGSYHHHPIYMTSPGVFDEQGLCWNPCFLFVGATLRLGGVHVCLINIHLYSVSSSSDVDQIPFFCDPLRRQFFTPSPCWSEAIASRLARLTNVLPGELSCFNVLWKHRIGIDIIEPNLIYIICICI